MVFVCWLGCCFFVCFVLVLCCVAKCWFLVVFVFVWCVEEGRDWRGGCGGVRVSGRL